MRMLECIPKNIPCYMTETLRNNNDVNDNSDFDKSDFNELS